MPALSPHACFACRKVFKKPHEHFVPGSVVRACPHCGGEMAYMGYKFRAPPASNANEWKRIENALREGRDYGVKTVRKKKTVAPISPRLTAALGAKHRKRPFASS